MVKHRTLDSDKVLAAAHAIVMTSGLAALNFQTLAQRLDIRSQSLYHYFPNIEAIIETLGAQWINELHTCLTSALAGVHGQAAFSRFAELVYDYFTDTGKMVELLNQVPHCAPDSPFTEALQNLVGLLKQQVAEVKLRTMDEDAFVQGFISSVMGFIMLALMKLLPSTQRHNAYQQVIGVYLAEIVE